MLTPAAKPRFFEGAILANFGMGTLKTNFFQVFVLKF